MPTSFTGPGYACTDHVLDVPLDHADPSGPAIQVYAREVVAPGRRDDDLPWLLYLQGGPGNKAPRPGAMPAAWLERALREYRVLLLDQRGTGRSTPANRQTLPADPKAAAGYLGHFRADSIVRDAELLRRHLAGDRPWSVLGQSFGGFCAVTYLSIAPEGLSEVFITGGLPSLTGTPDDWYRAAYPRIAAANERYFARYPEDEDVAARIAAHLDDNDERLPGGERLTARRFQTVGIGLGHSVQFDNLHYLLEEAFVAGGRLSDTFLRGVDGIVSFAAQPLYALVHESCVSNGTASNWAAARVLAEFPEFEPRARPFRFLGETILPFLFEEDPALAPLRECADLVAAHEWPALYDADRLASTTVPVAAAVYYDDMYVDREMSMATAAVIPGIRTWVTSEYAHNGLSADAHVLDRLIALRRGEG
ncbi:alpha/beta fold hydrolase [Actinomadura opuntiae]|uniref:alpha/beta fold hydrolase n=1 Tax=Actinomadura sp. OS1-43 TaxID=604315 RepID=UPI00255A85DA|nr:alpha/beta fold hydrolase [Actinomadura sp. OS1-43]MDL4815389.1 alpha/beta fold hydrolase [Actinomadura sp. OS1-43]